MLRAAFIFCFIFSVQAFGSGLPLPWVDASLKYIRISVWEDGIYRVSRSDLNSFAQANGENISGINKEKFALYFRGEEIPLIENGSDFLFLGRRNDGALDSLMYLQGADQGNTKLNLYSDTCYYFLTWYTDSRIGKRDSAVTGINPIPLMNHHTKQKDELYFQRYYYGENFYPGGGGTFLRYGSYQSGEGYTGVPTTSQRVITLTGFDQLANGVGVRPYLEIGITGILYATNTFDIRLGGSTPRIWKPNTQLMGASASIMAGEFELTDFDNDTLTITINVLGGAVAVSSISVKYPTISAFSGKGMERVILDPGLTGSSFKFAPANLSVGSDPADVLCLGIGAEQGITSFPKSWDGANGRMEFQISGVNEPMEFWFLHQDSTHPSSDFHWFDPEDLSLDTPNLVIITHERLIQACEDFADYRRSAAGGGLNVRLIEFEDLANYFSFGEFSPIAIKNSMDSWYDPNADHELSYFIVGKGYHPLARIGANYYRFNPEVFPEPSRIPPWGFPGSDLPASQGLDPDNPTIPVIPIGRINVSTNDEAEAYFAKVIELEDPANKGIWQKQALHLSGGKNENEISEFFGYVNSFKNVAEAPYWGGQVKTFSKTVTGSTENIIIDSVVNEGIALLTMYGHSSVNFADIQIGEVDDPNLNYNNKDGKFPVFLINGCYSGRIYESFDTWVENWTTAPEKGAIGVITHSDQGFNPIQKFYSQAFYESLFSSEDDFGLTIGQAQIKTIKALTDNYGTGNHYIRAQNELMILHGDPNIRISYSGGKTDYAILHGISASGFNGEEISSDIDSFSLQIPIANLGLATDDPIRVKVIREEPFFEEFPIRSYPGTYFLDTLDFTIPGSSDYLDQAGRNRFVITIDPGNPKGEIDTVNNSASFEITIPWKGVDIVFPRAFSIVPDKFITLQLASYDPVGKETYEVEIDHDYSFSGTGKLNLSFQPSNGYLLKRVNLESMINGNDSTVFYLRAKEIGDTVWNEISFSYFPGSDDGWSQGAFGQHLKNQYLGGLFPDSTDEGFVFGQFSTQIELNTAGSGFSDPEDHADLKIGGSWMVLNTSLQEKECKEDRLNIVRINRFTGLPSRNLAFADPRSCGVAPMGVKSFSQADLSDSVFFKYLNGITEDELLLAFSVGELDYQSWGSVVFDTLAHFGLDSALIINLKSGQPFAFLGRRNAGIGETIFRTSDSLSSVPVDSQLVSLDHLLSISNQEGEMISTIVGPSIQWKRLFNRFTRIGSGDEIVNDIYGINNSGVREFLFSAPAGQLDIGAMVNAEEYPYMYFHNQLKDSVDRSAAKLDHWGVTFERPPDGYLREDILDSAVSESVVEGQLFSKGFWFVNHTSQPFPDSLRVRISLNGEEVIKQIWIDGPSGFDSVFFEIEIETQGLSGVQNINVFVNPFLVVEETYQNNFVDFQMNSERDVIPPILEVYFDGVQIQDGDVVRKKPRIDFHLRDENPFLPISDPELIYFDLFRVEGFDETEIEAKPGEIQYEFYPSENELRVNFQPDELVPGDYFLRANGRDVSGNRAGFLYYEVGFKVNAYEGITDLEFFPNPFATRLNMSFFLSGHQLPDQIELQFYNRHGKMAGSVDLAGQVKLGQNRIYDVWKGLDQSGLGLQGGLYFVKLLAGRNGNLYPVSGQGDGSNLGKHGYAKLIYLPVSR